MIYEATMYGYTVFFTSDVDGRGENGNDAEQSVVHV